MACRFGCTSAATRSTIRTNTRSAPRRSSMAACNSPVTAPCHYLPMVHSRSPWRCSLSVSLRPHTIDGCQDHRAALCWPPLSRPTDVVMRAHYLTHVPFEKLGAMEPWFRDRGDAAKATRLYHGETLPA